MVVTVDDDGVVDNFPYHDGYLTGVLIDEGGHQVDLSVRSIAGDCNVVRLSGVTGMSADGLAARNIVFDIRVLPVERLEKEDELRARVIKRITEKVSLIPAGKKVFVLECSYGIDIVAICDEVDVRTGELAVRI